MAVRTQDSQVTRFGCEGKERQIWRPVDRKEGGTINGNRAHQRKKRLGSSFGCAGCWQNSSFQGAVENLGLETHSLWNPHTFHFLPRSPQVDPFSSVLSSEALKGENPSLEEFHSPTGDLRGISSITNGELHQVLISPSSRIALSSVELSQPHKKAVHVGTTRIK